MNSKKWKRISKTATALCVIFISFWALLIWFNSIYSSGKATTYVLSEENLQTLAQEVRSVSQLKDIVFSSPEDLLHNIPEEEHAIHTPEFLNYIIGVAATNKRTYPALIVVIVVVGISFSFWLLILRFYDQVEPEPIRFLLWVAVVGGLISSEFAGLFNTSFSEITQLSVGPENFFQTLLTFLFVGFNEEILKFLATYLLIKNSKDFNEPVDAMIYGMTVALGFATFENIDYVWSNGLSLILVRSVFSVPGHLLFAAVWSFGLALHRFKHQQGSIWKSVVPWCVALSAILHCLFDLFLSLGSSLLIIGLAVSVSLLILFLHLTLNYLSGQSLFLKTGECRNCRTINAKDVKYCSECGYAIKNHFYKNCPVCENRMAKNAEECPNCTSMERNQIAQSNVSAE